MKRQVVESWAKLIKGEKKEARLAAIYGGAISWTGLASAAEACREARHDPLA